MSLPIAAMVLLVVSVVLANKSLLITDPVAFLRLNPTLRNIITSVWNLWAKASGMCRIW